MIERLRSLAQRLKADLSALALAARDSRTPWYAQLVAGLTVAYALSPIDLIPDFIPVLGYLDDLILVPLGLWLSLKLIPPQVLAEARAKVAGQGKAGRSWWGAALVIAVWTLLDAWLLWRFLR